MGFRLTSGVGRGGLTGLEPPPFVLHQLQLSLICQSILHCTARIVTRMSMEMWAGSVIYSACLLLMKSDNLFFLGKIPSYQRLLWPSTDLSPALHKILAMLLLTISQCTLGYMNVHPNRVHGICTPGFVLWSILRVSMDIP